MSILVTCAAIFVFPELSSQCETILYIQVSARKHTIKKIGESFKALVPVSLASTYSLEMQKCMFSGCLRGQALRAFLTDCAVVGATAKQRIAPKFTPEVVTAKVSRKLLKVVLGQSLVT